MREKGSRYAIVGSREFAHIDLVRKFIKALPKGSIVISGGARGVDKAAVKIAQEEGLETEEYPADWDRHGRAAGYIRNQTIIDRADFVAAFWDGASKGTKHSIDLAMKVGKPITIFRGPVDNPFEGT